MRYDDIKDMTNEEAVAYYSPVTSSYIPCSDLENLLGWAGLAKRNAVTGAWEGSLIDFMNSNAVPALSDGLSELFSHLNKPRSTGVDSNEQPWAGSMADLLGGLEAAGQITASFTADVVALAGGYAYPDLDVDAVQLLRDEHDAQVAEDTASKEYLVKFARYNELHNIHIVPLGVNKDSDDASWIAALNAMASDWSN